MMNVMNIVIVRTTLQALNGKIVMNVMNIVINHQI